MQEVRRAVERVDDPDEFAFAAAAAFFAEKFVLRVALGHRRDDLGFRLAIHVGDEIVAAFSVDFERIEPREAPHDRIAGAPGGAHTDIEQWMHNVALE